MKKVVVAGAGGFMGGMGFIETHKADCMLSVLINAHLLMIAAKESKKLVRFN